MPKFYTTISVESNDDFTLTDSQNLKYTWVQEKGLVVGNLFTGTPFHVLNQQKQQQQNLLIKQITKSQSFPSVTSARKKKQEVMLKKLNFTNEQVKQIHLTYSSVNQKSIPLSLKSNSHNVDKQGN